MQRMLRALFVATLVTVVGASFGFGAAGRSRQQDYRSRMVGGHVLARSAGSAAIQQMRNSPQEWGGGVAGYAKRYGSSLGQHAVKGTIQIGVGAWHHEDQRYYRSNQHGTWPRLKYAVTNTFVVRRKKQPGRTLALGRISGSLSAGLISRAWQPASAAGIGAGLASGGTTVGADVGINVAREFWPRHTKANTSGH
jgi:hypothetical protein